MNTNAIIMSPTNEYCLNIITPPNEYIINVLANKWILH